MRRVTIDARGADTIAEVQRRIHEAFGFPEYYGRNLDALHDMLCAEDRPTHIELLVDEEPEEALAAYLPRLVQVMADAAQRNDRLEYEAYSCRLFASSIDANEEVTPESET